MAVIFNSENHTYYNEETKKYLISTTQLLRKHNLSPDYSQVNESVLKSSSEHGTLVHKELEEFAKNGTLGWSDEFQQFYDFKNANGFEIVESEWLVHNDIVAGMIDCVIKKGDSYYLCDYKTTTNRNIDSVSWQLSVYKALQTKYKIEGLIVFHFKKDGLEVLEIKEKPQSEVEKLFDCERKGQPYKQELLGVDNELIELSRVENQIVQFERHLKQLKEVKEHLSTKLVQIMEERTIKKYENDFISITYKAPLQRKTIDTKALAKDHPDIAKEYERISGVKASVIIKIK